MNWHGRQLPATHNVIATFDDVDRARHAIEVLERSGIDSGDIALLGPAAVVADRTTRDRKPVASKLRIARGMLTGALLGLAIGTLVGWISGALFTDGRLVAAILTGALAGLVGGSLFGAMSALSLGDAWEMTQVPGSGAVAVNVGSDDARTIARAHARLEHERPTRVQDFDDIDLGRTPETRWVVDLIDAQNPTAGPYTN